MRIFVVAASFPSLNQSWLITYIEQLIENDIQFSVLSFKNPADIKDEKYELQHILEHTIFLSSDLKNIISIFLSAGVNYKLAFLIYIFKCIWCILPFQLGWKVKLRMLITGAYLSSNLMQDAELQNNSQVNLLEKK
jgi:hypothetical protein